MARRAFWKRLGTVVATVAITSPAVALVLPLGVPPGERVFGTVIAFVGYGWLLYLPGMLAYVVGLPPLLRRVSLADRKVAIFASPVIMAVPLLGLVALVLFGHRAPDDTPEANIVAFLAGLLVPAAAAGAVVPLPERAPAPGDEAEPG